MRSDLSYLWGIFARRGASAAVALAAKIEDPLIFPTDFAKLLLISRRSPVVPNPAAPRWTGIDLGELVEVYRNSAGRLRFPLGRVVGEGRGSGEPSKRRA